MIFPGDSASPYSHVNGGPSCFAVAVAHHPASTSSQSVWSVSSSQSSSAASCSDSESYPCSQQTSATEDSQGQLCSQGLFSCSSQGYAQQQPAQTRADAVVPPELRQNPRRSSTSSTRSGCPPSLVRQSDRKVLFVDSLVDSSTHIVETIWPLSLAPPCRTEPGSKGVLPLRTFIQETLRRSRTSYSTLQVALYYLILIKPHVPKWDFTMEQPDDCHTNRVLQCGRRMFLSALILASKYLQDRNYSARAWSKISGLATQEINQNETAFLSAVNWKLHITEALYNRWSDIVLKYTPTQPPSPGGAACPLFHEQAVEWRRIIKHLTPELDNLEEIMPRSSLRSDYVATSSPRDLSPLRTSRLSTFFDSPGSPVSCPGAADAAAVAAASALLSANAGAPRVRYLATPRLTPPGSQLGTPAVGVAACGSASRVPSMHQAMAHSSSAAALQYLDRRPGSALSSPSSFLFARRSSLGISRSSSPESMISDTSSRSSRSSFSSASSICSSAGVDSARQRMLVRQHSAKSGLRMANIITPVQEDCAEEELEVIEDELLTASPESYLAHPKDLYEYTFRAEAMASAEDRIRESAAALTLQSMQSACFATVTAAAAAAEARSASKLAPPSIVTRKRSREMFQRETPLQHNVRGMLLGGGRDAATPTVDPYEAGSGGGWSDELVRGVTRVSPTAVLESRGERVVALGRRASRKRLFCSAEAGAAFAAPVDMTPRGVAAEGLVGAGSWLSSQ